MQPSNRPIVFISYSSIDKFLARRLARRLVHSGVDVIIDEADLRPGQNLTEGLRDQIRRSTHLVVIWTEASAGSYWVDRELEFARGIRNSPPAIIPLLVIPPGHNSAVSDVIGVPLRPVYRFEEAFRILRRSILAEEASMPSAEELRQDLSATIQRTPSIAGVLRNPVEDLYMARQTALAPDIGDVHRRLSDSSALHDVFAAWTPETISVRGLPTSGDPDYHALDFALWCAAQLVLLKRTLLAPLYPVELNSYPGIFGRVFAATQAGYEALMVLLTRHPGLSPDALGELTDRSIAAQASLPGIVDLFEEVIGMCGIDPDRDQITPYAALARFIESNLDRLTSAQKLTFFQLVDRHAQGPHPGPPVDVLANLARDPEFTADSVDRVRRWVEGGLFDGFDAQRRSDSPALCLGFLGRMLTAGRRQEAESLVSAVRQHIRKLFRSADAGKLVTALCWIAKADQLPIQERYIIEQACSEGIYSSEFEQSPHAELVRRLAMMLVDSITRNEHTSYGVIMTVQAELENAGLPWKC